MKYSIISNEKRNILLKRVLQNNEHVKNVAEELKIKFPSAKSIIRTFKLTGRVFNKKKAKKAKSNTFQENSFEGAQINSLEAQNSKEKQICEKSDKNPNEIKQESQIIPTVEFLPKNLPVILPPYQTYPAYSTIIYFPYIPYP